METTLFTYGMLSFSEVMEAICGRSFEAFEARLADYFCAHVAGADYPGVVPRAGAQTPGRVYLGVDPASVLRLDRFEGEMYERRTAAVVDSDGAKCEAELYVVVPSQHGALLPLAWDRNAYARERLAEAVSIGSGFRLADSSASRDRGDSDGR